MKCTFLRLLNQISVTTGKAYTGAFADELSKHNHASAHWINSEALKKIDVSVKADQVDHGVTLAKGTLYNASQTTNPGKVESLSGRLMPRFALSGGLMRVDGALPVPATGENAWLTESQVAALELTLTPSPQSTTVVVDKKAIKCYPMDCIVESKKLQKALEVQHFSLASGTQYTGSKKALLLKSLMQNGFTSGVWLTPGRVEAIGAKLKPNQAPTAVSGEKSFDLYNIDQLEDKSVAEKLFAEKMSYQISGTSGKNFPRHVSEQLHAAVKKNPSFSRYWLSASQAHKEGGALQGEEPVTVTNDTEKGTSSFFNATQLKSYVLRKCVDAHRKVMQESF